MAKLTWDAVGERYFEAGVEQTALFPFDSEHGNKHYGEGVAWSGITQINEGVDGGDENEMYADDIKYAGIRSTEKFNPQIEAYTYPEEFAECDGSKAPTKGMHVGQQRRKLFGLAYKSKVGNDTDELDAGYKLHLVYGVSAAPSERQRQTINDNPDAMTFSWDCSTTPEAIDDDDYKPTAHIEFDNTRLDETAKNKLKTLEKLLFGQNGASDNDPGTPAYLPTADSVIKYMKDSAEGTAKLKYWKWTEGAGSASAKWVLTDFTPSE